MVQSEQGSSYFNLQTTRATRDAFLRSLFPSPIINSSSLLPCFADPELPYKLIECVVKLGGLQER